MTSPEALLTASSEQNLAALRRALRRSQAFSLFLVLADGPARSEVRSRLAAWSGKDGVPELRFFPEGELGARAVLGAVESPPATPLSGAVIVDGDTLVEQELPVHALNVARDVLGRLVAGPLVILLTPRREVELSRLAPDLFAVRRAAYELETEPVSPRSAPQSPCGGPGASPEAAALFALEQRPEPPPPEALANAWLRHAAAQIERAASGERGSSWADALDATAQVERLARPLGYHDATSAALRLRSRIQRDTDHLPEAEAAADEALALAEEHLGDSSRAAALDEVAANQEARGALAEALRTRNDRQIPLLERLGDARALAEARGKVAGILQAQGEIDRAITLLRDSVVPTFERLADTPRSEAAMRRIAELLEARGDVEEGLRVRVAAAAATSPYPGLDAYNEDRADDFFGREAEIEDVIARLNEGRPPRRWLHIDGASGAGKSSFARAALLPAVRAGRLAHRPKRWITTVFRPGLDPVDSLCAALRKAADPPLAADRSAAELAADLRGSRAALAELLRAKVPPGYGFLLLADQLEEAFTLARIGAPAQSRLDGLLAAALDADDVPLLLVTTMRSDFLARMPELPLLEERLSRSAARYYLGPMSEAGLRAAIERPAQRAGLSLEPGLTDRILREAGTYPGTLPLVAHVLQGLYATGDGHRLTLQAYEKLGGAGGALARSADALVMGLGPEDQRRARSILLRLVKIGRGNDDTRRTATRAEVLAAAGGGPEAERVLARLSGGAEGGKAGEAPVRLVVVSEERGSGGVERVDLVHEALIQRWDTLRAWLRVERRALELRDDVEEATRIWKSSGSPEDGLPKGAVLGRFGTVDRAALGEDALGFLEAAKKAEQARRAREEEERKASVRQARRRWLTRLLGLSAVPLVVGLALLIWQLREQAKRDEASLREKDALLAEANAAAELERDPGKALAWIAEAARLRGGFSGEPEASYQEHWLLAQAAWRAGVGWVAAEHAGQVYSVAFAPPELAWMGATGELECPDCWPHRKLLFSAGQDGKVRVVDLERGGPAVELPGGSKDALLNMALSPDGQWVAAGGAEGVVHVWEIPSGQARELAPSDKTGVSSLAVSADGSLLAAGYAGGSITVWDTRTWKPAHIFTPHKAGVVQLTFPPDPWDGLLSVDVAGRVLLNHLTPAGSDTSLVPTNRRPADGYHIAFSPDGSVLGAAVGRQVALFSRRGTPVPDEAPAELGKPIDAGALGVSRFTLHRDAGEDLVVLGTTEGEVSLWARSSIDTARKDWRRARRLHTHETVVRHVSFSRDGAQVLSAGDDGRLFLGDTISLTKRIFLGHKGVTPAAALSADGRYGASAGADGRVRVWATADGAGYALRASDFARVLAAPTPEVRVAAALANGQVEVWDHLVPLPVHALDSSGGTAQGLCLSADGQVTAGTSEGKLIHWTRDGVRDDQRATDQAFGDLVCLENGDILAGGSDSIRRWRAGARSPEVLAQHPDTWELGRTPDGWVFSGSRDGTAALWDPTAQRPLATMKLPSPLSDIAALGPRSAALTLASGEVLLWDTGTGHTRALGPPDPSGASCLAASADGTLVASGSRRGEVSLRWVASGLSRPIGAHWASVYTIIFSADGRFLVSGGGDSTVRVWPLPPTDRAAFHAWLEPRIPWEIRDGQPVRRDLPPDLAALAAPEPPRPSDACVDICRLKHEEGDLPDGETLETCVLRKVYAACRD